MIANEQYQPTPAITEAPPVEATAELECHAPEGEPDWKNIIHPHYSWTFLTKGIHAMNSMYVTYTIMQDAAGEWFLIESGGTTHMDGYGITKPVPKSIIHDYKLDLDEFQYSGYGGGLRGYEYILDLKRKKLIHRFMIAIPDCPPSVAAKYPELDCLDDRIAFNR